MGSFSLDRNFELANDQIGTPRTVLRRDGRDAAPQPVTTSRPPSSPTSSLTTTNDSSGSYSVCDNAVDDIRKPVDARVMRDPDDGQTAVTTKEWTLKYLLELGMEPVERVSALESPEHLQKAIRRYEDEGVPMIIENWHETPSWPQDGLFSVDWLLEHGEQRICARNCVNKKDDEMQLSDFIAKSRSMSHFAEENETERYYGKDALCPKQWRDWLLLQSALPEELLPGGPEDVLEFLGESERVETLMCYLGIGDTYTAAHKDLCASSGHNLMCYTENGGSSFWFMTRSSDAPRVAAWFQKLGYELDHETYVVPPEEFAKAPFRVYVAEQKLGDLVLVPKRSCHQVVNYGGLTVKTSWSRMTVNGLVTAFHHELPVYRRVCRQETYRVKLLTYRALLRYSEELDVIQQNTSNRSSSLALSDISPPRDSAEDEKHRMLYERLRKLLELFDKILAEECSGDTECELRVASLRAAGPTSGGNISSPSLSRTSPCSAGTSATDGLTCDFCGADIFQSFFECKTCISSKRNANEGMVVAALPSDSTTTPETDPVIICPCCYVEGRSCLCKIMTPVQRFSMERLIEDQNLVAELLNQDAFKKDKVLRFLSLSTKTMHTVDHPQIFASACKILSTYVALAKSTRYERACSKAGSYSHVVPSAEVIGCKICHRASCFAHILDTGFHASEAIRLQARDSNDGIWHSHHIAQKLKFPQMELEAQKAEEEGTPTDMRASLVLYTRKFSVCFPFNQETVRRGWYDAYCLMMPAEDSSPRKATKDLSVREDGKEDDSSESLTDMSTSSSSRSPSPTTKTADHNNESSRPAAASTISRAASTGSQTNLYVELPTTNNGKHKKPEHIVAGDPTRAKIAKEAANKGPRALTEVFNGLYGKKTSTGHGQASTSTTTFAAAATSTSKQTDQRATATVPSEAQQAGKATSIEPQSPTELKKRRKGMKNMVVDSESDSGSGSDSDYREGPPAKKKPSKRASTTFRPVNLPKNGPHPQRPSKKRKVSLEDGLDGENLRSKGDGKEVDEPQLPTNKKHRMDEPKLALPKFTKKRDKDSSRPGPSTAPMKETFQASAPAPAPLRTPNLPQEYAAIPPTPDSPSRPPPAKQPAPLLSAESQLCDTTPSRPTRQSTHARPPITYPDLLTSHPHPHSAIINTLRKKLEDLQTQQSQFEVEAKGEVGGLVTEVQRLALLSEQQRVVIERLAGELVEMSKVVWRLDGLLEGMRRDSVTLPVQAGAAAGPSGIARKRNMGNMNQAYHNAPYHGSVGPYMNETSSSSFPPDTPTRRPGVISNPNAEQSYFSGRPNQDPNRPLSDQLTSFRGRWDARPPGVPAPTQMQRQMQRQSNPSSGPPSDASHRLPSSSNAQWDPSSSASASLQYSPGLGPPGRQGEVEVSSSQPSEPTSPSPNPTYRRPGPGMMSQSPPPLR